MRICKCGNTIPNRVEIDGKQHSLRNRKTCLICCSHGSSIYSKRYLPTQRKIEQLERGRIKQKRHCDKIKKLTGVTTANLVRKTRKLVMVTSLGKKCLACGYDRDLRNLVFHHLEGATKEIALSERAFQFGWEKIFHEIKKCVLLCHNCHGEIHSGTLENEKEITNNMAERLSLINLDDIRDTERAWIRMIKDEALNIDIYELVNLNKSRIEQILSKKFIPEISKSHSCPVCKKQIPRQLVHCSVTCARKSKEIISWPDNLHELIKDNSICAIARKLGVSDKAVAKRLKNH